MIEGIFVLLIGTSCLYWGVACWSAHRFFRKNSVRFATWTPGVSILKPVKGLDADAYENFHSFCRQDYGEFEILFGVNDEADPAIPLIQRLQCEYPEREIRLVVVPESGANPKSGILHELTRRAQYDILSISDSDIRVTSDYLHRVVAPLGDPQIGVVTCLYRSAEPKSLTARLEGLYLNTSFVPSAVLAGTVLGTRFGLGATLVVRRSDLNRIGGYAGIADYLSDDYHLAARIAQLGRKVHLSDYVVDNVLGATTFRQQWEREVRWARSIRALCPRRYGGLIVTFATPVAATWVVVSGFSSWAMQALVLAMLLRWLLACRMLDYLGLQASRSHLPWLPLRDGLTALVWCFGLVGRCVAWRGRTYQLTADGRLTSHCPSRVLPGSARKLLESGVRRLDAFLRSRQNIYEYSDHPQCLFRLSIVCSNTDMILRDGTSIRRGDLIGELHLWNEHLPRMSQHGPDMAWGQAFGRRCLLSLKMLASHIEQDERLRDVRAIRSQLPLASRNWSRTADRISQWIGCELVNLGEPSGWGERLHHWGNQMLTLILAWTFNAGALRGKSLTKQRWQAWMSRQQLLTKYGPDTSGKFLPAERPKPIAEIKAPYNRDAAIGKRHPLPQE